MKVSTAMNFFSKSVAAGLRYSIKHEGYSKELETIAWFVEFMDTWFHLMTSRYPVMALSRLNEKEYANAIHHLQTAISLFQDMVIGKQWKPIQTGVILSTNSVGPPAVPVGQRSYVR